MESISFPCFFEAVRKAGEFPASREGSAVEVPFSETIEKSFPGAPQNPVSAEDRDPGEERLHPESGTVSCLPGQLPLAEGEPAPQALFLRTLHGEARSDDGKGQYGPEKMSFLREALQALRHPKDPAFLGELKGAVNALSDAGGAETDPESGLDPSDSEKGVTENSLPSLPSAGPRNVPPAGLKRQPLSEEPETESVPLGEFLQNPLDPAVVSKESAQGASFFPVRGSAELQRQRDRFGIEEKKNSSGQSAGTDARLAAFLPLDLFCLSAETSSAAEGFTALPDSSLPAFIPFPEGFPGKEIQPRVIAAPGNRPGRPAEFFREGIPWNFDPGREAVPFVTRLPDGSLLQAPAEQGTLSPESSVSRIEVSPTERILLLMNDRQETQPPGSPIQRPFPGSAPVLSEGRRKDGQEKVLHPFPEQGIPPYGASFPGKAGQAGPERAELPRGLAVAEGIAHMTAYLSSSRGRQRGILRLHPPELGDIRVVLLSSGDRVRLHLTVESPEIREMVSRSEETLREGLRLQGIQLGEMTVDVNGEPGQGFGSSNSERSGLFLRDGEEGFPETAPEEVEARVDLVSGMFTWVA